MNELGRRNGEGIARNPRTRGAVVETRAERHQHVGLTRRVVGLIMAAARDHAERQRMKGVDRAQPAHRRRHRNLQTLGKRKQFRRRAAVADGLPDKNNRTLGVEQHVDGFDDAFGIGAATAGDIAVPFLRVRRFLGGRLPRRHRKARPAPPARAVPSPSSSRPAAPRAAPSRRASAGTPACRCCARSRESRPGSAGTFPGRRRG